jgi:mannose/fructose-specific phosphotransferase system component IIA
LSLIGATTAAHSRQGSVKLEQQIDRIVQRIEAKLSKRLLIILDIWSGSVITSAKKAIRLHNERVVKDREQQLERAIEESVDFENLNNSNDT